MVLIKYLSIYLFIMLFAAYFVFTKIAGLRLYSHQIWHHDKNVAFPIHCQWDPCITAPTDSNTSGNNHWKHRRPKLSPVQLFGESRVPAIWHQTTGLKLFSFVFNVRTRATQSPPTWELECPAIFLVKALSLFDLEKRTFFCLEWQYVLVYLRIIREEG